MGRRVLIAGFLAVLAAMPAMARTRSPAKSAGGDPVVARINGDVVHRSDLELVLRSAPPEIQKQGLDKLYPRVLNTVVNTILLAQAGRRAKIDRDEQVREEITATENRIIANAYVASLGHREITEQKLRKAYDKYAKEAPQHEEVHARQIVVKTEKEAKEIIAQLKKGANFVTLAKKKTIDPAGRANGGDLGYFIKEDMEAEGLPQLADVAFALKPGEFSLTPIHTRLGWHIIKVEARRPGKAGPYQEVAPEITRQMVQQIVAAKLKELWRRGRIEVYGPDGKPIRVAAPERKEGQLRHAAPPHAPAPTLALPGGGFGGSAMPPPKLSPATAPDRLK